MPALKDILSCQRTDAKLMIKAVGEDIDPYTIEIQVDSDVYTFPFVISTRKHTYRTQSLELSSTIKLKTFSLLTSRRNC